MLNFAIIVQFKNIVVFHLKIQDRWLPPPAYTHALLINFEVSSHYAIQNNSMTLLAQSTYANTPCADFTVEALAQANKHVFIP